jgi:tetratricopeptide (TPR) repeat protein
MQKLILAAAVLISFGSITYTQNCLKNAKDVAPVLSPETRKQYESKLAEANETLNKDPEDVDAIIWQGRRTAYLGEYKSAIKIFTDGIRKFPNDARLYRHRGHRYITLRCFDDAIKDLEKAAEMTRKGPDVIEPDGLPNARNIPTSTLQTNIWYHLGLAYYLKGDWSMAAAKFMGSYNRAYTASSPDMMVASAYWAYMCGARFGKPQRAGADQMLKTEIKDDLDIIENHDYYKLIKLNKGQLKAEDLLKEIQNDANTLGSASLGYGLGNYFLYNGEKEKAIAIFRKIVAGNQWASFGYIAAEAELARNPR